jgi:hypothetical protein
VEDYPHVHAGDEVGVVVSKAHLHWDVLHSSDHDSHLVPSHSLFPYCRVQAQRPSLDPSVIGIADIVDKLRLRVEVLLDFELELRYLVLIEKDLLA